MGPGSAGEARTALQWAPVAGSLNPEPQERGVRSACCRQGATSPAPPAGGTRLGATKEGQMRARPHLKAHSDQRAGLPQLVRVGPGLGRVGELGVGLEIDGDWERGEG